MLILEETFDSKTAIQRATEIYDIYLKKFKKNMTAEVTYGIIGEKKAYRHQVIVRGPEDDIKRIQNLYEETYSK